MKVEEISVRYKCPACGGLMDPAEPSCQCTACRAVYPERDGILYLLPPCPARAEVKESEREGWRILGSTMTRSRDYCLALPFVDDESPVWTHFREAARAFRMALEVLGDIQGKAGLDLGGSLGWAAYRFAQAGARMWLLDFDDGAYGLKAAGLYVAEGYPIARVCGDAERMPLDDAQFDFVFCCSALHHLTDPQTALEHVYRILKPGGVFFSCNEAFCPLWLSRRKGVLRHPLVPWFHEMGINEQVYFHHQYLRWFSRAGFRIEVINPRWDVVRGGRVSFGQRVWEAEYQPEILTNRRGRGGVGGAISRGLLASGLWKIFRPGLSLPAFRYLLFSLTQKHRIMIARKSES